MNYSEFLLQTAEANKSIACLGLDPVLEKIPAKGNSVEEKITNFYSEIINACVSSGVLPGACKPNYAFYAQYGWDGLRALRNVCALVKENVFPLILDAKRGDIGKTSDAYAKEVFEFWGVDAVTVAPYMGADSVLPFIKWSEKYGKGVYVLNRTSNEGAKELQNLDVKGEPLYIVVSRKITEWGKNASGNVGAVVGATNISELQRIHDFFSGQSFSAPYLIPGVGGQGGSAKEVFSVLSKKGNAGIHRINSSSAINYAYEKNNDSDYAGAAVNALKELNNEIGFS
ncbi:MAG: orotidine-5'-phosphate decarboxylase [archaeon]